MRLYGEGKNTNYSPQKLRDSELLQIILRNYKKGEKLEDHSKIAKKLIADFGTHGLFTNFDSPQSIMKYTHLPLNQARVMAAVAELLRRILQKDLAAINTANDAFRFFADMQKLGQEQLRVACLNPENIVYFFQTVAIGKKNVLQCSMSDIFRPVFRASSDRIIIAHNHPNTKSKPLPSDDDLLLQKKILNAGMQFDIVVEDHIIVAENGFYSFRKDFKGDLF